MPLLLVMAGCCEMMPPGTEDCDPDEKDVPKATECSSFALACFDELTGKRSGLVAFVPGARWDRTDLTWQLTKPLDGTDLQAQLELIDRAFALWADESALTFTEVDSDADIRISFESGDHGDSFPFGGSTGVLGHAFFPSSRTRGVIHINADRFPSLDEPEGPDLFTAVLHEIGHALGVEHLAKNTVMSTEFTTAQSVLTDEDVDAIRRLYGDAESKVVPVTIVPGTRIPVPEIGEGDTDSDLDGIADSVEVLVFATDPYLPDTDGDGIGDFKEIFRDNTDPLVPNLSSDLIVDSDSDGLTDAFEVANGTDPNCADSDADLIDDGRELVLRTDPLEWDTDGDGQADFCDPFPTNSAFQDSASRMGLDCTLCGDGTCDCGETPISCPADCISGGPG